MYTAPEGYEYIQADYVQAEAVCVSYIINDGRAKHLFAQRRSLPYSEKGAYDIHKLTASQMFGIPLEEVTKELRRIGKTLRHAGNYDAGPAAIATTLGCNMSDAKSLKELYHRATPGLRLWYQRIQEKLRRDRTLTNQFGRIHKFMGRLDDSLFRSAYAYDPQSTVGDMLNRALVKFYEKYGKDEILVLQLHDAMYALSRVGRRKEIVEKLLDAMIMPLTVNHERMVIEVDFKYGPSWGEQYEFDHEELVGTDFVQNLYNNRKEVN
jgi:DNA polymerase-1